MPVRPVVSLTARDDRPETTKQADTLLREWRLKNTIMVGRDVSIDDLYPELWSDWSWEGELL